MARGRIEHHHRAKRRTNGSHPLTAPTVEPVEFETHWFLMGHGIGGIYQLL
jgi:hypothetical protein